MSEQTLPDGTRVRVDCVAAGIIRIRALPPGDESRDFGGSALNRYGFIQDPDPAAPPFGSKDSGMTVRCEGSDARIEVDAADGKVLLRQTDVVWRPEGVVASFRASPGEDWMGFGDQTRERLFHRGRVVDCHVRNVRAYAPVPFFLSTAGVAVLVNTTHRTVFDMCAADPDRFEWRDGGGRLDYYVMAGGSFLELLQRYTLLTGRPKLPPEWSFGLWYIARTQANDYEVVNDALNFRREEIPCDVIGFEPGWMETFYDASVDKKWSTARFPIPRYAQTGQHNFFNAIRRMGFRMELWLCCDYDLSHEEERRRGTDPGDPPPPDAPAFYGTGAEVDEHFARPRYLEATTRIGEPWFDHLKKFVDQGVDFFKQDGAYQVMDHPDRRWGNGMDDAEMHNLYPLLYARQMHEGFEAHARRRGFAFTPCGWSGFQAWAGTWTGDTGGKLPTLGAMLNTAAVGHSWATNDMEVAEPEGIHFGYLLPWSQINSWNYFRMPWVQGARLRAMHAHYARLRSRLVPYLYSWAWEATRSGRPLMMPLALEFPDDLETRKIIDQYLLGRDLMVTVYKDSAHFPAGRWKDFWGGRVVEGGGMREVRWPADRGGGLFVREGAIIPFGPLLQYRGEMPVDAIDLYVFPGRSPSAFTLYRDDGTSLEHREGRFETTLISVEPSDRGVTVTVGPAQGDYAGKLAAIRWSFSVALDRPPAAVYADGALLPASSWSFDEARGELAVPLAAEGAVSLEIRVRTCPCSIVRNNELFSKQSFTQNRQK